MDGIGLLFARALVRVLTCPGLRWWFDLPLMPRQLDREWGIPYHFRILRLFHRLRSASAHWPRCASLWVIGSNGGHAFAGNSAFLFLHQANRRSNRAAMVWVTQSPEVIRLLRRQGYPVLNYRGLGGILACMLSGYQVISHENRDVNLWVSEGARRLQLWHGLPIKKLYWDVTGEACNTWLFLHTWHGRSESFWRFRAPWLFGYGEHWAYASPGRVFSERLAGAFHGNREAFHTLGSARGDYLLDPVPAFEWLLGDHQQAWKDLRARSRKVILYLPTWRELDGAGDADRPLFQQWAELNAFLAERQMTLVYKGHDRSGGNRILPPGCDHIALLPEALDSTYLMAGADALVTDYSSVYVDYLLLDRPIGFFWFDEAFYRTREHEMYEDMQEHLPGPVLRTLEDWQVFLEACSLGEDPWRQARRGERDRLYDLPGGGACERTLSFLEHQSRPEATP